MVKVAGYHEAGHETRGKDGTLNSAWKEGSVPISEEFAVAHKAIDRLRAEIVRTLYNQAAVYEAKKKRADLASFEWGYYNIKQGTVLVLAKAIEHMDLDGFVQ